ncbi:hypothetical protein [Candidatus Nitrosocosmicus franklandus]|uniref:Uncharacterized protein n=1 Tax=Candidatus Nitrosocosmicus franklandianus TaxID=1798806 RepID=A0A484I3Y4_9ARCH|nr:hypothetical protein [Candidatus Nitrosocosmicus franklandus]VFJ12353.1 protein of unknown function [Candidatus Nitrosocosmicus franklandus]
MENIIRGISDEKFRFLIDYYLTSSYTEMVSKILAIMSHQQIPIDLQMLGERLQIINMIATRYVCKLDLLNEMPKEKAIQTCEGTVVNYLYDRYIHNFNPFKEQYTK